MTATSYVYEGRMPDGSKIELFTEYRRYKAVPVLKFADGADGEWSTGAYKDSVEAAETERQAALQRCRHAGIKVLDSAVVEVQIVRQTPVKVR